MENELESIKNDVDKFLSDNRIKYEIFSKIIDDFVYLSEENYDEYVQYIENHKDTIFKDHGSAIYFYMILIRYAEYYFKKFELYLDIIAHFSTEIKNTGASELFHFIYSQKRPNFVKNEKNPYFTILDECLLDYSNDNFKFVFMDAGNSIYSSSILVEAIEFNSTLANFILDLQLDEVKNGTSDAEDSLYSSITFVPLKFDDLLLAVTNYNEDVVVKLLKLYDFNMTIDELIKLIETITEILSTRMIHSLFTRLNFLPRKMLVMIAALFQDEGYNSIFSLIMNNLPSK